MDWGKSHPREAAAFLRSQGIEGRFENVTSETLRCIGFTTLCEAGRIEAALEGNGLGPTPEPTSTLDSITSLIDDLSIRLERLNDRVDTLQLGTAFQIFVKTLANHRFTYEVKPSDTIAMVKEKITDDQGIPIEKQRLVFAGMELENCRTLANCGIQKGSVLILVLKLGNCGH